MKFLCQGIHLFSGKGHRTEENEVKNAPSEEKINLLSRKSNTDSKFKWKKLLFPKPQIYHFFHIH